MAKGGGLEAPEAFGVARGFTSTAIRPVGNLLPIELTTFAFLALRGGTFVCPY